MTNNIGIFLTPQFYYLSEPSQKIQLLVVDPVLGNKYSWLLSNFCMIVTKRILLGWLMSPLDYYQLRKQRLKSSITE